jgi:hypothetical protein
MQPDMASERARDTEFAERVRPQIERLLLPHAGVMVEFRLATEQEDTRQATDLVARVPSGQIALRVRRDGVRWRDLTLRYQRRDHPGGEWYGT